VRCTRALHAYLQSICFSAHTPVCVTHTHLVAYYGNCRNKYTWMWMPELDGDWSFLAFRPHFEWSLTLRGACWSLAALSGPFVCVCGEEVKREALVLWKKALKSNSVLIPMSPLKVKSERGRGLIQTHEIYISILFQSGTCINRESSPSHNVRLALHSLETSVLSILTISFSSSCVLLKLKWCLILGLWISFNYCNVFYTV